MTERIAHRFAIALLAVLLGGAAPVLAGEERATPAEIEVNGLGWWDNREQRVTLERLLGEERGTTLDANAVEDAVFLLMSALTEEGYLKPVITAKLRLPGGPERDFVFDASMETLLPRPLEATRATFNIKRGERYQFRTVNITGLSVLPADDAREYFVGEKVLIALDAARIYTPARLERGLSAIDGELRRRGYADATVVAKDLRVDDRTGDVDVTVEVVEGRRWVVDDLRIETGGAAVEVPGTAAQIGQPWSQYWQQDTAALIRNHYYRTGHPDVTVRVRAAAVAETAEGGKTVRVLAEVTPGEEVRVGEVHIEGSDQTRESVIRRRIRTAPGGLLNPLELDQARFRLSRLGVFERVDLRYEPEQGPVRSPVFELVEGRELEVNLLFGYGSYEQVRGGVELRQFNLFGRAHQTRLLLVQSFKSSRGEYSYTMPELLGESIDATARIFGLQREETAFLRQEYGGNFSMSAPIQRLGANATLGYTYQSLQNQDNTLMTRTDDEQQVTAASIEGSLVRDRRDNPLRPRRGYRIFIQGETASRVLGGSVDYQRLEFGGSYHTSLGRGRWLHVGMNHGVITTFGGTDDTRLPVNKRFFPGGDNSIRGYQSGEAAPRGADGRFVGAKSYVLGNLEFEQALTTKWSATFFADALGTATQLRDYPFSEQLYSVGLGVRYHTLIGPLRAEYGHNLNPRTGDPRGTVLLAIGVPF